MIYSPRGLAGTIIFHVLILLLLIFFGFSYPDPPPEEQGVLVNFGTDITGKGEIEPAGDETQGGKEETMPEVTPVIKEPVVEKVVEKKKETAVTKNTQTVEETKVKETKPAPTAEELRQIEVAKQQAEELKKKKAEEERQRQLAEQWNTKGKNAFGNKGVGTTTGSEGVTEGNGNQGSPDGTPGAPNYGDGGGLGNGINYGMGGRGSRGTWPEPMGFTVSSKLVIVVSVKIDREGNVIGEPEITSSTFSDESINSAVLKAASAAKFTADPNAPFPQKGWIKYTILPK